MGDYLLNLSFLFFAALTLAGAASVLMQEDVLHAAVSLFFALLGIAGLYIVLGADFLGVAQLLIYAGGILVLLIFGVFLTRHLGEERTFSSTEKFSWGLGVSLAFLGLACASIGTLSDTAVNPDIARLPKTAAIGEGLLTNYVFPFEAVSVLLLFAMIGAVMIVRDQND